MKSPRWSLSSHPTLPAISPDRSLASTADCIEADMAEPKTQIADWSDVWIAIPAYNEARSIRALAEAALLYCARVIVVDDGSVDGTSEQLQGLPITVLQHECNRGKAASLRTAFAHALAHG